MFPASIFGKRTSWHDKKKFIRSVLLNPRKPLGFGIALVYSVTAAFMDPLFFYTRAINDGETCIEVDKTLGVTTAIFRSLYDLYYLLHLTFNSSNNKYKSIRISVDVLTILPLPQVVVILSMDKTTRIEVIWKALFFVIFQYVLRILRVAVLLTKRKTSGSFYEWAAVFMFNYLYASHMFGALWYYLAIDKVTEFWETTIKKYENQCSYRRFPYCDDKIFVPEFCRKKLNASNQDFGLYNDARKYSIMNSTDYKTKLLFCFRWGLQNLSCFGQSLQTGKNVQDNLYIVSITLTGVLLFFFLMGRMQVYLQNETMRVEETKQKWEEIKRLKPIKNLSNKQLKMELKTYLKDEGADIKEINIKNLLNSILSKDLKRKLKQELCPEELRKVQASRKLATAFEDRIRPVFYTERQYVIREGDLIDEMLFIVSGDLRTYTATDRLCNEGNHLKDGECFGEELMDWAQNRPSSDLPISTKTIRALTNVEAFVLSADDLQEIFSNHKQQKMESGNIAEEP